MLTKRLNKLISALPQCDTLADVGCDHGYVGIEALERNVAARVVFVDVSVQSLKKARENCPERLKTRADFVCQDGLGKIFADCAVIAGMGGLEILSVLKGAKALPQKLVLQPMRNQQNVRIWLADNYEILSDEKFFDGKFYDLIVAKRREGGCVLTEDEITFGKNVHSPSQDFIQFLLKEKKEYEQILQQCSNAEVTASYNNVCRLLAGIREEQK